jgi:endo-1,4-beta-D-glucanase Y
VADVLSLASDAPTSPDTADTESRAESAAARFLDRYVSDDGRVVRRDQGDDTVSEGQAYALLLAAAIGDRERFDLVWSWTAANLQRPDALLAWHWADGRVVDPEPAADADLDAARALLLAGERCGDRAYRDEAVRIGAGILTLETVGTDDGRVLVAGPWARVPPVTINPSYVAPRAYSELFAASGDQLWASVARTGRDHVRTLTLQGLPPDWARLDPVAGVRGAPPPGDDAPETAQFGLDAARVPVRFAEDCDPVGREVAASLWPDLRARDASHPLDLVAAAAAAHAAGARRRRNELLDAAERRERAEPGYYGAAWVALGRVLLTTDLAGRCDVR